MNNTNYKTRFCDQCGMPLALHNLECQDTPGADLASIDMLPTYTFGDGHVYYRKNEIGALCTSAAGTGTTASAAGTIKLSRYKWHPEGMLPLRAGEFYLAADAEQWAAALAEEARREGYREGVERQTQVFSEHMEKVAQRTAGGDAVKLDCGSCLGTGNDGRGTGCTDCNGKGYDWEPVAEAAAQADDVPVAYMWTMHGWTVTAHSKHRSINRSVDVSPPSVATTKSPDFIELIPLYTHPAAPTAQPTPPDDERAKWSFKQWWEHVGAWETPEGFISFGSPMAVRAMLIQYGRMIAAVERKRVG